MFQDISIVRWPFYFFVKVAYPKDLRSILFNLAIREEVKNIIDQELIKTIFNVGKNSKIAPLHFVLPIKKRRGEQNIYCAHFVVGGHRDHDNQSIIFSTTDLKQKLLSILLALGSRFRFDTYSVTNAYFQSDYRLKKRISLDQTL